MCGMLLLSQACSGSHDASVVDLATDAAVSASDARSDSSPADSSVVDVLASIDIETSCRVYWDEERAWQQRCGEPSMSSERMTELRLLATNACARRMASFGNVQASELSACAAKYAASTNCDEIPCELPYGIAKAGTDCGSDSQCASDVCIIEFGNVCGTCDDALPGGSDCSDGTSCAAGLMCEKNKCTKIIEAHLGEACGPDGAICAGTMACSKGKCAQVPSKAQEPCLNGVCGLGFYCNNKDKCASYGYVKVGDACGDSKRCEKGECSNGKCKAPAAISEACGNGTYCDAHLVCREGTCAVDDPTWCSARP